MQALELPAMLGALVFSFGVILAKVMTTSLIVRMNQQINQVVQMKSEALGRLKVAQSQKQILEKNKNVMGEMEDEESARKKRTETRRVT